MLRGNNQTGREWIKVLENVLLSTDSVRKSGAARLDAVCVKSKTCKPQESLKGTFGCKSVRLNLN